MRMLTDVLDECQRENEQLSAQNQRLIKRAEQAEAARERLREALTALLAQSDDPNAVTGQFDTAAGRARRLLNAGAALATPVRPTEDQ